MSFRGRSFAQVPPASSHTISHGTGDLAPRGATMTMTQNRIYLTPAWVPINGLYRGVGIPLLNGAADRTYELGLYTLDLRAIWTSGTVTMTSTTAPNYVAFPTPIQLGRGHYWLACVRRGAGTIQTNGQLNTAFNFGIYKFLDDASGGPLADVLVGVQDATNAINVGSSPELIAA